MNKKIYLLVAITLLPILISTFLFYHHTGIQLKTINHGQLINPPISSQALGLLGESEKKWQIVYVPSGCCDDQCEHEMFTLHQIRVAMGKESKRINLVLVVQSSCPLADLHDFKKSFFTLQQLINALSLRGLGTRDPESERHGWATNKIYLIDPLGNLFMYYSKDQNPMDILKDLKKVLEVSQIG